MVPETTITQASANESRNNEIKLNYLPQICTSNGRRKNGDTHISSTTRNIVQAIPEVSVIIGRCM